jgi:hypothetical protein
MISDMPKLKKILLESPHKKSAAEMPMTYGYNIIKNKKAVPGFVVTNPGTIV